jgi:hypothetical protein
LLPQWEAKTKTARSLNRRKVFYFVSKFEADLFPSFSGCTETESLTQEELDELALTGNVVSHPPHCHGD